ncbi:STAS domain-containing protein [Asanoa iriomotensis]|uniref:Anti-sigma factor antagonist n=1 Tax=Asanoa iriomotensis TaxID=234613 RepID=A0ABQ4C5I4_9ACTN|nr:STAS domain-containing protein [Asanoa iriomotensis]GIF58025.1 hypothetical protein Air01nite_41200 [Asanoa iriomotensis]
MTRSDGRRPAELALAVRSSRAGPWITAAGDLDADTADDLRTVVTAMIGPGREVTVDLADVAFIDSHGVFVLVRARQTAADHGGTLRVTNCQPPVRRVLEIAAVLDLLTDD